MTPNRTSRALHRSGLTLLELVVIIALVGLLAALLLPAIQSAREAARNTECRNKLRQLGLALHNYESTHGMFPPSNCRPLYSLLPFLDEGPLFDSFNPAWSGMEPEYQAIVRLPQPKFDCPGESAQQTGDGGPATSSYLGNAGSGVQRYGYNGLFRPETVYQTPQVWRGGPVRVRDVRDGMSNTAAIAEVRHGIADRYDRLRTVWQTPAPLLEPAELDAFAEICRSIPDEPTRYGWRGSAKMLGGEWVERSVPYTLYTHVLTPNNPSCSNGTSAQEGAYTAGSLHQNGANILYADGHVHFISDTINGAVWRDIGSRVEYDLLGFPF